MCEISWVCAVLSVSTALNTCQIRTRCSSRSYWHTHTNSHTHTYSHTLSDVLNSYSFKKVLENNLKTPSTRSSKTSTACQTHELSKHELTVTFIQSTVLPAEIWPMRSIRRATRVDQGMTDLQKRDVTSVTNTDEKPAEWRAEYHVYTEASLLLLSRCPSPSIHWFPDENTEQKCSLSGGGGKNGAGGSALRSPAGLKPNTQKHEDTNSTRDSWVKKQPFTNVFVSWACSS